MHRSDRLALLIHILDPEDYRYIGDHDLRAEARFRQERVRVFREGLCDLSRDILDSFQERLANLNAAGRWSAYPGLVLHTASMFASVAKLWVAGTLFAIRFPMIVNLVAQRERLQGFLNTEASAPLYHSPA